MTSMVHRVQSACASKCSVCLEEVQNPRRLACDHKFCKICLKDQFSKLSSANFAKDRVTIVCPYCRDYFLSSIEFLNDRPKDQTPTRTSVVRRPLTARAAKSKTCQPCSESKTFEIASFWCQDCTEFLCSACARYHKMMKMFKLHIVKTLKDKERYGQVKSRLTDHLEHKPKTDVRSTCIYHETVGFWCDPCGVTKKRKEARFWCEACKEKLCSDCSRCHGSMKMTKSHNVITMRDVISKSETKYSLDVECACHPGEVLGLYCKRCQTSCCGICAIIVHEKCGAALKAEMKKEGVAKVVKSSTGDPPMPQQRDKKGKKEKKFVTIESTSNEEKAGSDKTTMKKCIIPKNRMENRKSRISYGSVTPGDWVISLVVLNSGDILFIELYQNDMKMMTNKGDIVSTVRFYGDPWSVAVYNDSLAVVSFSDRKQLQLINISRYGLEAGKLINTHCKSLSVCFTKDLIVTSCWDGCIHIMNIVGNELSSIDKDHNGYKLFTNPEYIAADKNGTTVYVTDYKQNSVTALKLLPNRIDNKPVWTFKDSELQGPKGIAVDQNGVLYISGMSSRNIVRLSPEGEKIQVYRRRDDRDHYEALAISQSGDRLYASAYEEDTIIVFALSNL